MLNWTSRADILTLFLIPIEISKSYHFQWCLLSFFSPKKPLIELMLVPSISSSLKLFVFKSWKNIECIKCFSFIYWKCHMIFFILLLCWIILFDCWMLNQPLSLEQIQLGYRHYPFLWITGLLKISLGIFY